MEQPRTLDWVSRHDPRSRDYPISDLVPRGSARRRNKMWRVGPVLDQGREGACVGFAWTGEALSTPIAVDLERVHTMPATDPTTFAQSVYHDAQRIDEWEGEQYEGTSVLAGAKVLKRHGLIREYRWAFGVEDVVDAVLARGPVVLGVNWHSGMYSAPDGVLTISGGIVGGHALIACGYRVDDLRLGGEHGIVLQNSWGPGWGVNGLAVIRVSDVARLLADGGEACVPVARSYGRTPV